MGGRHANLSSAAGPPTGKISAPVVRGLDRERLTGLIPDVLDRRLGLVVAPAGSGKTTLLAQMARRAEEMGVRVAWFRAESSDVDVVRFVAGVEGALAAVAPDMPRGAASAEDLARALDSLHDEQVLLAIDDFHAVDGSPVVTAVETLVGSAPHRLSVLIASRSVPAINVPRFRLADALIEVGPDALRFRSWEIEQLYKDVYGEPLSPDDIAELAGRTEGWAAGLQLFHLATKGMSHPERHTMLERLGRGSRIVREYLARNLIETLPEDLRGFLVRTSVLAKLDARLCDALLERTGSSDVLEELARRQICTPEPPGDDASYRYHEVFRLHLEALLVEQLGETAAREMFRRAGVLLEEAGALPEALHAYSRAEDAGAVQRILGRRGRQLADNPGGWTDWLPHSVRRQDPWLLLASARNRRARGRVRAALDAYREAERDFVGSSAAHLCRREALTLLAWLERPVAKTLDWSDVMRRATVDNPLQVREEAATLPAPHGAFVSGIASLMSGDTTTARASFSDVIGSSLGSHELKLAARAGDLAARVLSGDDTARAAEDLADQADRTGAAWFALLARALVDTSAGVTRTFSDPWGSMIASFFEGWSALASGQDATPPLRDARGQAAKLGARVFETWIDAALALAATRADQTDARRLAVRAEREARSLGVRGAQGLAALALVEGGTKGAHADLVTTIEHTYGLRFPRLPGPSERRIDTAPIAVWCFGGFRIERDGIPIDLGNVRPLARRALRILAIHGGRPVHREVLIEALWSEMDPEAATRNLQVAISSLRAALDLDAPRPEGSLIARSGKTYRLALPSGSRFDLIEFEDAVAEARAAKASGNAEAALAACDRALDLYRDGLLPEDGPAEWVLGERTRREVEAVDVAFMGARLSLDARDAATAVRLCERLIAIDRYQDAAWRLAIDAYEAAGDVAAAARTRARYAQILVELDIDGSFVDVKR